MGGAEVRAISNYIRAHRGHAHYEFVAADPGRLIGLGLTRDL